MRTSHIPLIRGRRGRITARQKSITSRSYSRTDSTTGHKNAPPIRRTRQLYGRRRAIVYTYLLATARHGRRSSRGGIVPPNIKADPSVHTRVSEGRAVMLTTTSLTSWTDPHIHRHARTVCLTAARSGCIQSGPKKNSTPFLCLHPTYNVAGGMNSVFVLFVCVCISRDVVKAQYTPPTRLNCRVASRRRRRCEQNSQPAHDDCRRIRSTIWKLAKQTPQRFD